MKQLITFGITFLLFFSIVTALDYAPTIQTGNDLNIIYPKIETYDYQKNITLAFEIVNNSGATCAFNLYDKNGKVLLSNNQLISLSNKQYINLSTTTLNNTGKYDYSIVCNNSNTFGYLSTSFMVKRGGFQPTSNPILFAAILFIPLLFAFLLVKLAVNMEGGQGILKLALTLITFPLFLTSLNFAVIGLITFYETPFFEDNIVGFIQWTGYVYWAIIALILFSIIVMAFDYARGKKQEREDY